MYIISKKLFYEVIRNKIWRTNQQAIGISVSLRKIDSWPSNGNRCLITEEKYV